MSRFGNVGWLDLSQIEEGAKSVLKAYHPTFEIPIPVEWIIDTKYGIDIIPVPGLENFDCVGYIDSSLNAIYVDQYVYSNVPNRYRFTLAHEFSHLILHADLYTCLEFETVTEWKIAFQNVPSGVHDRLEFQANMFAGYLLVPTAQLELQAQFVISTAVNSGFNPKLSGVQIYMESALAKTFQVSADVMGRRCQTEHLWEKAL